MNKLGFVKIHYIMSYYIMNIPYIFNIRCKVDIRTGAHGTVPAAGRPRDGVVRADLAGRGGPGPAAGLH